MEVGFKDIVIGFLIGLFFSIAEIHLFSWYLNANSIDNPLVIMGLVAIVALVTGAVVMKIKKRNELLFIIGFIVGFGIGTGLIFWMHTSGAVISIMNVVQPQEKPFQSTSTYGNLEVEFDYPERSEIHMPMNGIVKLYLKQTAIIEDRNISIFLDDTIYSPCSEDAKCTWEGIAGFLKIKDRNIDVEEDVFLRIYGDHKVFDINIKTGEIAADYVIIKIIEQ
ncbi:MAG: hypothetical protein V1672_03080 [Candidatus Diapherotrites archaeon]